MAHNSSLTSVVKAHGHYSSSNLYYVDPVTRPEDTIVQMNYTQCTAILLIRNPYRVLYGYRNYNSGGHFSHAGRDAFEGQGAFTMNLFTKRPIY